MLIIAISFLVGTLLLVSLFGQAETGSHQPQRVVLSRSHNNARQQ